MKKPAEREATPEASASVQRAIAQRLVTSLTPTQRHSLKAME